jgi:hypothetical protein
LSATRRLSISALAGAALLLAATMTRLPRPQALFHPPRTPYDRGPQPHLAPAFVVLTRAREVVPLGASVTVTSEPLDSVLDSSTHHMGVALLPGRLVLPAALYGIARPDLARQADYIVLVGQQPAEPPGRRLLSLNEGSVWSRRP